MTAAQDRLATARQALQRAEAAAGLRTRLATPRLVTPGAPSPAVRDPALDGEGAGREVAGHEGVGHVVAGREVAGWESPAGSGDLGDHLPVPAALAGFFPSAGLRRGSVVQVGGSSSLLLALLAAAQGKGWVALAALPDVGLQAATEAGLSLSRTLLVPRPGPEAASVVGALVDGVDVLAVGDCRALNGRDRRLLSARLRSRGVVLLSTAHWPGADVVLRAGEARTGGLGRGWGQVSSSEVTVHGRGRGVAGRVRVRLGTDGLSAVRDELTGGALGAAQPPAATGVEPVRAPLQAVS